jgi:hypothetical protein
MNELARQRVKQYIADSVEAKLQEQVFTQVTTRNSEIGLGHQSWGEIISDGFRLPLDVRPPVRPSLEFNISTLLTMSLVNSREHAVVLLEAAQNDIDQAVTFAMAQRQ